MVIMMVVMTIVTVMVMKMMTMMMVASVTVGVMTTCTIRHRYICNTWRLSITSTPAAADAAAATTTTSPNEHDKQSPITTRETCREQNKYSNTNNDKVHDKNTKTNMTKPVQHTIGALISTYTISGFLIIVIV